MTQRRGIGREWAKALPIVKLVGIYRNFLTHSPYGATGFDAVFDKLFWPVVVF